jgi:uncharacterized repeat protein (TIGR01451 family)
MGNYSKLTGTAFLSVCAAAFLALLILASAFYVNFGAAASINVQMYVWDGLRWVDADTATGPYFTSGPVQFSTVVANTGNVPLTNVNVSDSLFGKVELNSSSLVPGEVAVGNYTVDWVAGQQVIGASVSGLYGGVKFTDSDIACYFGAVSSVDVQEFVWNGCAWVDADNVTGPFLSSGPVLFSVTVTNTGNVPLTDVNVSDVKYGLVPLNTSSLTPGEVAAGNYSMAWAVGQQVSAASVAGVYGEGNFTDTDGACYFGAAASVDVQAYVWNGSAWVDADAVPGPYLDSGPVQFSVVILNSGNVPLTNVTVSDSNYGLVSLNASSLAPGGIAVGNYSELWVAGQHVSIATFAGWLSDGNITGTDITCYFGSAPQPVDPSRVACVGDSITQGSGYTVDLDRLLGSQEYNVENFGAPGANVLFDIGKPYLRSSEFLSAKDFLPDVVIIMLGTNDAKHVAFSSDEFEADYTALINEFQALASKPKIWLVKPPPIYSNMLGLSDVNLVQSVIPCIERVANELGLPIIDVYAPLLNHPGYFFDGVHPNSEGARVIAEEIYKALVSSS